MEASTLILILLYSHCFVTVSIQRRTIASAKLLDTLVPGRWYRCSGIAVSRSTGALETQHVRYAKDVIRSCLIPYVDRSAMLLCLPKTYGSPSSAYTDIVLMWRAEKKPVELILHSAVEKNGKCGHQFKKDQGYTVEVIDCEGSKQVYQFVFNVSQSHNYSFHLCAKCVIVLVYCRANRMNFRCR